MFHHKSKGKTKKGESSSSQARSGMSADLFAVMILLNFYLHVLNHYYFTTSHLIYFIVVFVCMALWPPDTDRRHSLGFCTTRASRWPERGQRGQRFPRSRTVEQPSRRLPRSRRSRTRLVTSHRSPTG
jgi:hypothetical protein